MTIESVRFKHNYTDNENFVYMVRLKVIVLRMCASFFKQRKEKKNLSAIKFCFTVYSEFKVITFKQIFTFVTATL